MAKSFYSKDTINIPRGKLVGQNGPGSLYVNTEGVSYTISAVDNWYSTKQKLNLDEYEINDSRLEKLLNVSHFREVPSYRDSYEVDNPINSDISIPISRFPLVHYCSSCGYLIRGRPGDTSKEFHCINCIARREFIQFPIVIACKKGHLDDFPFMDYVHRSTKIDNPNSHKVTISWSGKSSVLNWDLQCSCGAKHSLKGITGQSRNLNGKTPFQSEMNGVQCTGKKPWIGDSEDDNCDHAPEALLKNSLRVYETEMVSALSLSETNKDSDYSKYDQILTDEFNNLSGNIKEKDYDKLTVETSFSGKETSIIKKVNYVRRLQEVIVQTGFSRLSAVAEDEALTNANSGSSMLFSKSYHDWLPAKRLYGEGIFIEFNQDLLNEWASQKNVKERFVKLEKRIIENYKIDRFTSPIHVLIHTLSHSLISELSNLSGYSMTSTTEKLYFIDNNHYGLLLYVTDTDKDGTFGGLVRLAEEVEFKRIFNRAVQNLDWCSSDPVCSEIGENYGQGLGNTNGSACHNCAFVPNTSCPHRNCYLDRDFVGKTDAPTCITFDGQYSWFESKKNNKHEIEIIDPGVKFPYKDWDEAGAAYEKSTYYAENNWPIPNYTDGKVRIDKEVYSTKYYNDKTKQVVLYEGQMLSFIESATQENWQIIIEK